MTNMNKIKYKVIHDSMNAYIFRLNVIIFFVGSSCVVLKE
jgi:hypothetical protein